MTIYKFPDEKNPKDDKKSHVHQPEYVILEEGEDGGSHAGSYEQENLDSLHYLQKMQFSLIFRFLFFWAGLVAFSISCLFFLFSLVFFVLALFTLHQIPSFQAMTIKFWNGCCRMVVFGVGLTTAAFSPVFGLGIIILYFLIIGESTGQNIFFSKIFKVRQ